MAATDTAETEGHRRSGFRRLPLTRRSVVTGLGVAGLFGIGVTEVNADPQGEDGSGTDPVQRLYTEEINGGVTGDTQLTDLVGSGLTVNSGSLEATGASGLWEDTGDDACSTPVTRMTTGSASRPSGPTI